jgi:hypothetical protein
MGLVYNPRGLPGVTTARPGVDGVLRIGADTNGAKMSAYLDNNCSMSIGMFYCTSGLSVVSS